MLSANLTSHVSKRTRERGGDYFTAQRVTVVKGSAWRVDATVQGSRSYDVNLVRERDAIEAWCSCPYCEDQYEPCKHIWATLLAAEARGYLQGDGRRTVREIELVPPDDGDDLADEEWFGNTEPFLRSHPRNDIATNGPQSRQPPRRAEAWKQTLSRLRPRTEQTPAIRPATLPPGHEIVYVVDRPGTMAGNGLALDVATRNRKRDGEWSKPKGRRFTSDEIAHLPDPVDRQAMAILSGGREHIPNNYYYGNNYYDSAPARFRLTHTLSETLVPIVCATGRCLFRESEPDGALRPLRWDDAGPWEFWLKVAPDEAGKTYAITGELRRGEARLAMETPLLLTSGGLVFWEDRVAPLRDFDAFQWIALLRDQGEVRVPAKQKQEFLAELLRLPDLPRLDLPDDLRYEEVTPAPRPYLKVKRRETRGWMSDRDQNWLVGDLAFEYDDHLVPAAAPARSVFEPDKRRLLLRDAAAEQTFAGRLEEVGFTDGPSTAGARSWRCSRATCPTPRRPCSGRAGVSRPRGSSTARRATSGSR